MALARSVHVLKHWLSLLSLIPLYTLQLAGNTKNLPTVLSAFYDQAVFTALHSSLV